MDKLRQLNQMWIVELLEDGKWIPVNHEWGYKTKKGKDGILLPYALLTKTRAKILCKEMKERFPYCEYRISKFERVCR